MDGEEEGKIWEGGGETEDKNIEVCCLNRSDKNVEFVGLLV